MGRFQFLVAQAGGLAVLSLIAMGCSRGKLELPGPPPMVVVVRNPLLRQVTDYEYFTGRTEAVDSVDVRARVTGYLLRKNFVSGGEVKKGQLLFKIDPRPYQAQLDMAKGDLAVDEAQLKLAIADYDRAKAIRADNAGAISQQDLDQRAAQQGKSAAAVQAAKAKVEYNQLNLDFTDVTSPIDGIVSRDFLTTGNLINQDSTIMTTIVSQDPMYAYFSVDELTLLRIRQLIIEGKLKGRGQGKFPVEFGTANEGDAFPHTGEVDFVNNQLDRSTGTITVRGVFPNPPQRKDGPRLLTPGMFVRVRVPVGPPHQALIVPQSAVSTDQGKKYLLVVDPKNVVEYRPIEVGQEQSGGWQVVLPTAMVRTKEGLQIAPPGETGEPSIQASDRVIVEGLQRVRPGDTVEIQSTDVNALPPPPQNPSAPVNAESKAPLAEPKSKPTEPKTPPTAPKSSVADPKASPGR